MDKIACMKIAVTAMISLVSTVDLAKSQTQVGSPDGTITLDGRQLPPRPLAFGVWRQDRGTGIRVNPLVATTSSATRKCT